MTESVAILGSTGSIGVSVLDVIRRHPDKYRVAGLSANINLAALARQCAEFNPELAVMADEGAAKKLAGELTGAGAVKGTGTRVLGGAEALSELAGSGADIVVCGIVGAAGLRSTLAAVRGGKKVLIANKEPLVMLGQLIMAEARASGATVIPVDSEHNAIFQCLPQCLPQSLPQDSAQATPQNPGPGGGPGLGHRRHPQAVADGLRRALPATAAGGFQPGHPGPGMRPSELGNGAENFGGFGHHDEQGA